MKKLERRKQLKYVRKMAEDPGILSAPARAGNSGECGTEKNADTGAGRPHSQPVPAPQFQHGK